MNQRHVILFEQIVDLAERKIAWRLPPDTLAIAQGDEEVFALQSDRHVVARALADGQILWQGPAWSRAASLLAAGDFVYVLGTDGRVDRRRRSDGDAATLQIDPDLQSALASPGGFLAIAGADTLRLIDGETGALRGRHTFGTPAVRRPDGEGAAATAAGRAEGWRETDVPANLHLVGEAVLIHREAGDGTELKRIRGDGEIEWERVLPSSLQPSFVDKGWIALSGSRFAPQTVVLDASTGADVARLNEHVEVAMPDHDALLTLKGGDLVVRDLKGATRWTRAGLASRWDTNHRLAACAAADVLVIAEYETIEPGVRLLASNIASGGASWSADIMTEPWTQPRAPFYHNLVSLEVPLGSDQVVVTIDQSQGLTVALCDSVSGRCWWRQSQEWRTPPP